MLSRMNVRVTGDRRIRPLAAGSNYLLTTWVLWAFATACYALAFFGVIDIPGLHAFYLLWGIVLAASVFNLASSFVTPVAAGGITAAFVAAWLYLSYLMFTGFAENPAMPYLMWAVATALQLCLDAALLSRIRALGHTRASLRQFRADAVPEPQREAR